MALVNRKNAPQTANNEDVAGYLNIKIVDANGVEHSLSRGIPLSVRRRLDASILAAVEADPDVEFKVVASVHVVDNEQEPILF